MIILPDVDKRLDVRECLGHAQSGQEGGQQKLPVAILFPGRKINIVFNMSKEFIERKESKFNLSTMIKPVGKKVCFKDSREVKAPSM